MKRLSIIVLACISALCARIEAETLVYREWDEKSPLDSYERTLTILPVAGGFRIEVESPTELAGYTTDRRLSIVSMYYRKAGGTELRLQRAEDRILIQGSMNGKPVGTSIELDPNAIWQQEWIPLIALAAESGEGDLDLFAISLSIPLRLGGFALERLPDESIKFQGKSTEVMRFKVRLSGAFGRIVRIETNYWVRKSDRAVIRSAMPKGIGGSVLISELAERRD
jgi:hypothetical protein